MDQEIEKISKKLMKELDEDRYRHTQGVMYTSAALAMRYDADLKKALLAGLLHDCAKCIPGHTKIKMCEKYNLEISEIERKNPSLLHAKLGAYLAKDKYDIELNNTFQIFGNNNAIFPFEYFCAKSTEDGKIKKTDNTYTIHHFAGSWLTTYEVVRHKIKLLLVSLFGINLVINLKKALDRKN